LELQIAEEIIYNYEKVQQIILFSRNAFFQQHSLKLQGKLQHANEKAGQQKGHLRLLEANQRKREMFRNIYRSKFGSRQLAAQEGMMFLTSYQNARAGEESELLAGGSIS